jgi:hypothetical protein
MPSSTQQSRAGQQKPQILMQGQINEILFFSFWLLILVGLGTERT